MSITASKAHAINAVRSNPSEWHASVNAALDHHRRGQCRFGCKHHVLRNMSPFHTLKVRCPVFWKIQGAVNKGMSPQVLSSGLKNER